MELKFKEAMMKITHINSYIDHTLLKADALPEDIDRLCEEAKQYQFASVCVNSCWVSRCARLLESSGVKVCSVVGFPLGAMKSESKAYEASRCVADGAGEIDMVINIGVLKSGDYQGFGRDIALVREACGKDVLLKTIIETCLLTDDEKVKACAIAVENGADFVKTSTGFSTHGATADDIALMRKTVGPEIGVKASGGIRSYEDARIMIEAGATRIGASSGIAIVKGGSSDSSY
jgi:deoxyribose-phosphate aldolase